MVRDHGAAGARLVEVARVDIAARQAADGVRIVGLVVEYLGVERAGGARVARVERRGGALQRLFDRGRAEIGRSHV